MRVVVLGANEVALVTLDAILSRGNHEAVLVIPITQDFGGVINIEPSPLNELNFGYPGVKEQNVNFHIIGERKWSQVRSNLDKAGWHASAGSKPMTSSHRIFESLQYRLPEVKTLLWIPEEIMLGDLLKKRLGGWDALVNTMDRSNFCNQEHSFMVTRVWWSLTKGEKFEPGNVVYNTAEAPAWAVSSNIDDRQVTFWEYEPPFEDVHPYDIQTRMACNCLTPGIDLHVGTAATYQPIGLARAYERVVEFLHHPMLALNAEDADTVPQEAIDGND